jgi:hypothetical protein
MPGNGEKTSCNENNMFGNGKKSSATEKNNGQWKKTLGNGKKRSAMEKKFRYGNNLGKLLQNISLNLS